MLVLGELHIGEEFLGEFGEVLAFDEVIGLQEDLTESALAARVVF